MPSSCPLSRSRCVEVENAQDPNGFGVLMSWKWSLDGTFNRGWNCEIQD